MGDGGSELNVFRGTPIVTPLRSVFLTELCEVGNLLKRDVPSALISLTAASHRADQVCRVLDRSREGADNILARRDGDGTIVADEAAAGLETDDVIPLGGGQDTSDRLAVTLASR